MCVCVSCVGRVWVCACVFVLRVWKRGRGVWGNCAGLLVMVRENGGAWLVVGGGERVSRLCLVAKSRRAHHLSA